jgi:hypothetical protein
LAGPFNDWIANKAYTIFSILSKTTGTGAAAGIDGDTIMQQ